MDFDKIPKPTYDELVSLIGRERAEEYIKKVDYDYPTVARAILYFRLELFLSDIKRGLKHLFNIIGRELSRWPYTTVTLQILIVLVIVFSVVYMLSAFNFI
ncbi:MAG: hypothetical protein CMO34_04495 [Verrucomicrobia bacterium]|nr:hypothetical protein [Verrucomicrobiota bacterium]